MTKEKLEEILKINKDISSLEKEIEVFNKRIERVKAYIAYMDGRVKPVMFGPNPAKKVEIKFQIEEHCKTNIDDMFDLAEENKEEFVKFLKNCLSSYEKKIKANEKKIQELNIIFEAA